MLAGVVGAAAVAGVVAAMLLSGGGKQATPSGPGGGPSGTGATTSPTTDGTTTRGTTGGSSTRSTTTGATSTSPPTVRPPRGPRRRSFVVGTVDDSLVQHDPSAAQGQVDASRSAGFDAALVSATWQRGQRRPPASLVRVLRNVAAATRRDGMQLWLLVWHGLRENTPRNASERQEFAAYAGAVVRALPQAKAVVVGNEPNLSTFWDPQFDAGGGDAAARAYDDLLARSYDQIKAARSSVLVLGGALSPHGADRPGGSRPTHSPTAFIRDLGAAYRASGRSKPLMDAFAIHPYMEASRYSPANPHPDNTTITIADYPKLVRLLARAFPNGARLPVYYTEFGVQTGVPASKRRFYDDLEAAARTDTVAFATQAAYYRRALELAYCQPTVRGLFVFHTFDEPGLNGWQSGLYFADGTPKPSLRAFRRAVSDLRKGRFPACRR